MGPGTGEIGTEGSTTTRAKKQTQKRLQAATKWNERERTANSPSQIPDKTIVRKDMGLLYRCKTCY